MAFTSRKFDSCNLTNICRQNNDIINSITDNNRMNNNNNCFFSNYPINKKDTLKNVPIESNLFNLNENNNNCDGISLNEKNNKLLNHNHNYNTNICDNSNLTQYTDNGFNNNNYDPLLIDKFGTGLFPKMYQNDSPSDYVNDGRYGFEKCHNNPSSIHTLNTPDTMHPPKQHRCIYSDSDIYPQKRGGMNTRLNAIDTYKDNLDNFKNTPYNGLNTSDGILPPNKNNNNNNTFMSCKCN
tara:strand:+ start:14355 stop:15071 length:717 start_codon:yes stop_codon:yes gene_type:complete